MYSVISGRLSLILGLSVFTLLVGVIAALAFYEASLDSSKREFRLGGYKLGGSAPGASLGV